MIQSTFSLYSIQNIFTKKPNSCWQSLVWHISIHQCYFQAHMRGFDVKALDCYDPIVEYVVVDIFLHGMIKNYRIYLENLSSSFSLHWWEREKNQRVRKISNPTRQSEPCRRKGQLLQLWRRIRELRFPAWRECLSRKKIRPFAVLPTFPCEEICGSSEGMDKGQCHSLAWGGVPSVYRSERFEMVFIS